MNAKNEVLQTIFLFKIQNNAARLVLRLRKFDRISHVLKHLHWLPITFRLQYKLILIVCKCIQGVGPSYLCSRIRNYVPARNLRSGNQFLLKTECCRTKYGERAFSYSGPKLFNSLPFEIRRVCFEDSIETVKVKLKTHLFSQAYV